ncbi:NAD dependent epimerase/dehydratase family protein [Gemmata obscuriglobus]|uniref:NAD-dependent epimerase/dehydratase family protein n=1 Tax=Gemmata obscuriglobus TaxID=114 RepID=UPI00016C49ED|nr:NAD-dependent epimerase/dehydratase family protein [Gemmata obscuriglobus]QEG27670.1 NAD dependent epimerase/dehydratase family protein [Gemmata obscuriglobus]VTS04863.1 sugar dehydratase : NAD dependent epimerase/dehydratase family OS=Coleofasciculus chthonoplastes PCC 7420 GN=MC7420_5158 PE=4 SV=1: Epimerase [Gemmata obscuriglobus UQM 2246]
MSESTSPWAGRRVLVTGCTGLLGAAVCHELFDRGAAVVGLIHERSGADIFAPGQGGRVHFVRGRADNVFRLHSAMAVHEVSAVFHLAAAEPFAADRGTPAVLDAVRLYSRRVPVVAARPLQPFTLTGHAEPLGGLSVARFGAVFGPGDRKVFRTAPATALALHGGEGLPPLLDGPATDHVFVRDAARACLRVAEDVAVRGPGDYPFRSGWVLSDRRFGAAMRDVFNGAAPTLPDVAPPANPLGWAPETSFTEALQETLDWYGTLARPGGRARAAA